MDKDQTNKKEQEINNKEELKVDESLLSKEDQLEYKATFPIVMLVFIIVILVIIIGLSITVSLLK